MVAFISILKIFAGGVKPYSIKQKTLTFTFHFHGLSYISWNNDSEYLVGLLVCSSGDQAISFHNPTVPQK
jgi:hypothetical protein